MKAELNEQYPIIEKLEYNFLINEDIYSFNTLMSLLYDKNFVKFSKNDYYVKDYVIKNLKKYFRNLSDIDQIAMTLENLVTDDLNRYEFWISVKAQYRAFKDKKMIDDLECDIINDLGVNFLMDNFYPTINKNDPKLVELADKYKVNIYNDKNLVSKLKENMGIYCDLKIKSKIYTLDQTTHKQLRFDTSSIYTEDITINQTKKIYEKSQSYLYKSIVDIYAEYYFRGLLREVLERYQ
ncbi:MULTISPECIES: hypothetical protein [Anaerococcus]|uniref:Uncharacterized protein n=1 Tax=Anaerococcus octavius TaxID=54007 RepID=A0A2I1M9V2_9FIRM|nr:MULTISPECIES: hypothetical protein [Anaerococcus]MBS6105737.1 hypothetical protein [Anaerococcus sp.]MDU2598483.1 hypothetical protein [Anaerococcus sp.]MDU3176292.1 hypothetical protein [Anaerococcus sp.]PKZ16916.1 hypothetical protein CYJ34_03785 [Anaerococcus octavius]